VKSTRGVTLLEMIVAATILAIAVVGLMAGLSGTTRNAARLQDYDRAVQLGRTRMNDLMLDRRLPRNTYVSGAFDPAETGGLEAGWKARLTPFELPPHPTAGAIGLDRVELQVWWKNGASVRTFTLDAYRPHKLLPEDVVQGESQ
jgi:prepilin-type N-terminal cleavage/methylation domain-containing protein